MGLELILATYAAILSTIIAFLNYRNRNTNRPLIIAEVRKELVEIECQITNTNSKPLLVKEIILSIGSSKSYLFELIRKEVKEKTVKNESEILYYSFSTKSVREIVLKNKLKQKEFQRLWITCITSINKKFTVPVNIHPNIIPEKYYEKAEQFIATDLFLGFEQQEIKVYPFIFK